MVLLFACKSSDDKTIAYLNRGIVNCNSEINLLNENYYTDAEVSIHSEPSRNRPYKKNLDSIKFHSAHVINALEKIKESRINGKIQSNNVENELFNSLSSYKLLLTSLFPEDSLLRMKTQILMDIDEALIKKYNVPELNLIFNEIQSINNYTFEYYRYKMERPRFRPNKIEGAVIPETRYIHQNELYKAQLYLLYIDSSASYTTILLEDKPLEIKEGKAIYMDKNTNTPGQVNKNGLLIFKAPWSDFQYEFPFTIDFTIKAK